MRFRGGVYDKQLLGSKCQAGTTLTPDKEVLRLRHDNEKRATVFWPPLASILSLKRQGSNANISEGDRPMIALQSQGPQGFFRVAAAGLGVKLYVLMDHFPVMHDFDEDGVRNLLAPVVEARGAEGDIKGLPLAGR